MNDSKGKITKPAHRTKLELTRAEADLVRFVLANAVADFDNNAGMRWDAKLARQVIAKLTKP